jgi:3-polyprenyl-4-hydroxybenzoate decarboxylase
MATLSGSSVSDVARPAGADLRVWLDEVEARGQLERVSGASIDYEIGAVTDLNAKQRGSALLFGEIPGFERSASIPRTTTTRS